MAVDRPADPAVSPADTRGYVGPVAHEVTFDAQREPMFQDEHGNGWVPLVTYDERCDELAALLAVGERDRRQIARLTEALEPFVEFADIALDPAAPKGEFHWKVPGEQMQRIPVWFGPSDFGNARAAVLAGEGAERPKPEAGREPPATTGGDAAPSQSSASAVMREGLEWLAENEPHEYGGDGPHDGCAPCFARQVLERAAVLADEEDADNG